VGREAEGGLEEFKGEGVVVEEGEGGLVEEAGEDGGLIWVGFGQEEAESDGSLSPLSPYQSGIWFLERTAPGTARHHLVEAFDIDGPLKADLLEKALEAVVARHDALRCSFTEVHGRARMQVGEDVVTDFSVEECEADVLEARIAEAASRPFDITRTPLHRALLLRTGPEKGVLCLVLHNLLADEASLGLICRDWADAYESLLKGADPRWSRDAPSYVARARREWDRVVAGELDEQLRWWVREFATRPKPLDLPTDRHRPPVPTTVGDSVFALMIT